MRFLFVLIFVPVFLIDVQANDTISLVRTKPPIIGRSPVYRIRPAIDFPIIGVGLVTNYLGIKVLFQKPGLTVEDVQNLTPDDVNAFDRGAARQNPAFANRAMQISDYGMIGTYTLTSLLLFDKKIRRDWLDMGILLFTTSSVMANAYSWGVGQMNRYRPYVYNVNESIARRTRRGSRNSFYGGHCAATACATFFAVHVFKNYNPDSKLTPYLYGLALLPPAFVGYYRYKAGMHFPSDLIVGGIAGATIGTLVPHFHKRKIKNLSVTPFTGPANGFYMVYNF